MTLLLGLRSDTVLCFFWFFNSFFFLFLSILGWEVQGKREKKLSVVDSGFTLTVLVVDRAGIRGGTAGGGSPFQSPPSQQIPRSPIWFHLTRFDLM